MIATHPTSQIAKNAMKKLIVQNVDLKVKTLFCLDVTFCPEDCYKMVNCVHVCVYFESQ